MSKKYKKIDRFEIQDVLGEGAFGSVFKAYDPRLKRIVAIKLLHARLDDDPTIRDRFYDEAYSMAQLNHPNILSIFDINEIDNLPYIVMTYIDGFTIKDMLMEKPPLTLSQKVELIIQVLDGLGYAHQHGIIHRDIKPGNIGITRQERMVKLFDFGIAKLLDTSRTQVGMTIGTPEYMAPEQIMGISVDHRIDLYSTGIILMELICYKKIFGSGNMQALFYKKLQEPVPTFKSLDVDVAEELQRITLKSLEKEADNRFSSAKEFADELRKFIQDTTSTMADVEADSSALAKAHVINAKLGIARKAMHDGELSIAQEAIESVFALDPKHRDALTVQRILKIQAEKGREDAMRRARRMVRSAEKAMLSGKWAEASGLVSEAVQLAPELADALNLQLEIERQKAREDQIRHLVTTTEESINDMDWVGSKHFLAELKKVGVETGVWKSLSERIQKGEEEYLLQKQIGDRLKKGLALYEEGWEKAMEESEWILLRDPDDAKALRLKKQCTQKIESGVLQKRRVDQLTAIRTALDLEHLDDVAEKIEEFCKLFPNDAEIQQLRMRHEALRKEAEQKKQIEKKINQLIAQGKRALQKGALTKAAEAFDRAKALQPEHIDVIELAEDIALFRKNKETARELAAKAERMLAESRFSESVECATEAADLDPSHGKLKTKVTKAYDRYLALQEQLLEAEELSSKGSLSLALEKLEAINIVSGPLQEKHRALVEHCQVELKKRDRARQFNQFLAQDQREEAGKIIAEMKNNWPDDPLTIRVQLDWNRWSDRRKLAELTENTRALIEAGRMEEAQDACEKALMLFPDSGLAKELLEEINLKAQQATGLKKFERLYESLVNALSSGEFVVSYDQVQELKTLCPTGKEQTVSKLVETWQSKQNQHERNRILHGYLQSAARFYETKNYRTALEHANLALEINPKDERAKDYRRLAIAGLESIQSQEKARFLRERAVDEFRKGNYLEALSPINKLLQLNPGDEEAQRLRDQCSERMHEKEWESQRDSHIKDARSAIKKKDWDKAEEACGKLLAHRPDDPIATELQRQIDLNKTMVIKESVVQETRIHVKQLYRDRQYAACRDVLLQMLEKEPEDAWATRLLAKVETKLNPSRIFKRIAIAAIAIAALATIVILAFRQGTEQPKVVHVPLGTFGEVKLRSIPLGPIVQVKRVSDGKLFEDVIIDEMGDPRYTPTVLELPVGEYEISVMLSKENNEIGIGTIVIEAELSKDLTIQSESE